MRLAECAQGNRFLEYVERSDTYFKVIVKLFQMEQNGRPVPVTLGHFSIPVVCGRWHADQLGVIALSSPYLILPYLQTRVDLNSTTSLAVLSVRRDRTQLRLAIRTQVV